MRWIIIFLLCSFLKASQNEQTCELFIPEDLRELFELPGRLISKNAETFPDLSTIYETYHKQLYDLENMQLHDNIYLKIVDKLSLSRIFLKLSLFTLHVSNLIPNIFSSDLPAIYEMHPDILSKSLQEQANIVHDSWESPHKIRFIRDFNQVQFSNDPIDRLGRLIINGKEVYRGISDPANTLTYEVILPEHLREIFELPGKLISNNAEIFPELSALDSEHYQTLYSEFQKIRTPEHGHLLFPAETLKSMLGNDHEQEREDDVRQNAYMLRNFLGSAGKYISSCLKNDIPKIFETHSDILDWSKSKQAKIVHSWYKDKWTFMTIKHIDLFMKKHARFSDAPEDRFGRLIVNGNSALGIHDEE